MKIDWIDKLRNLLQVMAFALVIATIQYAFLPDRPYGPPVMYSLLIGTITWAIVDLGRELFRSETGWPHGWPGLALAVAGIAGGYLLGTWLADQLCQAFGLYPVGVTIDKAAEWRASLLITVLAGITGVYYFYTRGRSAWLERKMAETAQHANEARLKLLEAQLEPHMLFNTLANLRALIGADPQRAQVMLDHMIAYLRATLGASRATTHSLEAEFARLRDYLALMAIRMGARLRYTLELPEALAQVKVPTLLLQPLVENAIQHGLEPKVEGGSIAVRAWRDGGRVLLQVEDTGVGLEPAARHGSGFGLAQVRERLQTVHGAAATLDLIAAQPAGTRATIAFPFDR